MALFDKFDKDDGQQFVISSELLQLLRWLFEHEQEVLKKLISKSLANGLGETLKNYEHQATDHEPIEELQLNIIEFFALLENLLYEAVEEAEVTKVMQKQLIPAINKIDMSACSNNTLASSVAKATSRYENNPKEDPKDLFLKELIKLWKPSKKNTLN